MTRHFRCEEPSAQCPHSRTRAVQVDRAGVCPIENPDCERYRRPVPLWTALRERNPALVWGGIGLLCLALVLLLLPTLLGGGSWRAQLEGLKTELAGLDSQLSGLLNPPAPPAPSVPITGDLERLDEKVKHFKQTVDQAEAAHAGRSAVLPLREQGLALKSELDALLVQAGPNPAAVSRQITAQQLVKDYEDLDARTRVAQAAVSPSDQVAEQEVSELTKQVLDGKRQAQRLTARVSMPAPLDPALIARTQGDLDSARLTLDQLASKPQPPFPPQDAGLSIAVSPTLIESLVLPLLQARFANTAVTAEPDDQRWFIAATDQAIAPGAVVTVAPSDPYGPLLDGSADLVLTDQAPDATVRARFAAAFGGQELDSRAFSEVVALDAVVLLAHPKAMAAPVDLGNLARGPWLVRSEDAASIRRLTVSAVTIREVSDPFQALIAEADARALAFHHQCGSNLRGKYLPFKPAPEAQAITPSPFSIATEDYRLAFRITAAHSPRARPAARQFIEYLISDPGQKRIAAQGFVDRQLGQSPDGYAPPEILTVLAKALARDSIASARRYPTNLHFGVNESELDIKAKADLGRLARDLPSGKIVILGFTDNTGSVQRNLKLSLERAQSIVKMLKQSKIDAAAAKLGQEFPVDTNDTEQGRARNRRAEVWVVQP